jgi:Ribonuclease D
MMDINYITQENQLESLKVLQDKPYLYLDTEVMIKDFENIDFFNDKIRLIQIGDEENTFVIDLLKINPEVVKNHIQNLIENKGIIGHNLKFDLKFLKTNLSLLPKIVFDTMIASQILAKGDNSQRHSLSASAKRFVSLDVDKTYQNSPWWATDLSSEQIEYAAKDIDALRHLFKEEKNQLNQDNLHKKASGEAFKVFRVINPVAALEMAFLPALVEIELSGIPIDEEEAKNY